jgi:hypothetical protein
MMRKRRQKEPLPFLDLAMLAVVGGFFAYSGYSFWNGKPRPPSEVSAPAATRSLAALPAAPAAPTPVKEVSTATFSIECVGSTPLKSLRTQASLLRVEGKLCGRIPKLGGRNLATDEELQIFLKPGKFTSHYFPLSPGLNKVVLEDRTAKPAKSQELEITREER